MVTVILMGCVAVNLLLFTLSTLERFMAQYQTDLKTFTPTYPSLGSATQK